MAFLVTVLLFLLFVHGRFGWFTVLLFISLFVSWVNDDDRRSDRDGRLGACTAAAAATKPVSH